MDVDNAEGCSMDFRPNLFFVDYSLKTVMKLRNKYPTERYQQECVENNVVSPLANAIDRK